MLARKISASSGASAGKNGRSASRGFACAFMKRLRLLPLVPAKATQCFGKGLDSHFRGNERVLPCSGLPPRALPGTSRSSCDLPGGAVLGILQDNAHGGELVADAVGLLEVLFLAGGVAGIDPGSDRAFVEIAALLPKHSVQVDRFNFQPEKLAACAKNRRFFSIVQGVQLR